MPLYTLSASLHNMATPILTIQGQDWMNGVSSSVDFPVSGMFSRMEKVDPFAKPGYCTGGVDPVVVDSTTITTQVKALVSGASGSDGYVVAIGNRGGTGQKCAYAINVATNTVTDESSDIAVHAPTGALTLGGAILYEGYIVYAELTNGNIRKCIFPTFASDANIGTMASWNSAYQTVFRVGNDGRLYFTTGATDGYAGVVYKDGGGVWQFSYTALQVQKDLGVKDFASDGTYLYVLADNNMANVSTITSDCKVFLYTSAGDVSWKMAYPIPDRYVVSIHNVAGRILAMGYSGIWQCGPGMAPQLVYTFPASRLPANPYQTAINGEVLYWTSASTQSVWAYGNPIGGRYICWQPHNTTGSDNLNVALCASGPYLYAGVDAGTNTPKVVALNYGSTDASVTAVTVPLRLAQPYKITGVKVTLGEALASGEAVAVSLHTADGTTVLNTSTKQYSVIGGKRSLWYEPSPNPSGTPIHIVDSFYLLVNAQSGSVIDRITVYGDQVDDIGQLT